MLVLVGYLDLQYLVESRARSLTSYQGNDRRGCSKTFSLFRRKLAQVTPKDPWRDPYIVALLIAFAQKQRRNLRRPQPKDSAFLFSPKLVLSSRKDRQRLFVYTSEIPSSFLDTLDNPTMTSASPFDMAVGVTEVQYEPYASLRERLFQILLSRRKHLHLIDDDADPSNHRPSTP
ncbi:hypothetical protein C2857_000004 [Epichloe festucae Fl1]|uniref:Uncharacterized protein n=1 Tax=Epichloe festucae (strain Fl1) TaxID=877507 RepID=A0A7U3Q0Y2_EPIFF|nr:hypothetical protein C2857_000004 [Epichloe festucae Fl1]